MDQNAILDKLVQQGAVWRGPGGQDVARLASGWADLDRLLGGGWPRGALVELLSDHGSGLGLLLPVLARLGEEGGWLAWVNPPHLPYAPALAARGLTPGRSLLLRSAAADARWAAEQVLRSGSCGALLAWLGTLRTTQIRRLQLAAETGAALGVLFRPLAERAQASPSALRLQVSPDHGGLRLQVLKRRGGWGGAELRLRP